VRQGGGLVMTGQAAEFDENNHSRQPRGLADLFTEPQADKALRANPGKGRAIYIPQIVIPEKFRVGMLPGNRAELLDAVHWVAGGALQSEVKAPDTVTMSLYTQPSGRRLLHLVNYDDAHPVNDIEVSMQWPSGKGVISAQFLSPESDKAQTLTAERAGTALRITVPRLEVYGLLVIE
jgi:hypothetical protein